MVVHLRLARFGRIHAPKYRIMVADSRFKRDGRHLECVGSYDPFPDKHDVKHIQFDVERIKYWLTCGAQPTKPVQRLLGMSGLLPRTPLSSLDRSPDSYAKTKHCRMEFSSFLEARVHHETH
eukprot:c8637_g1_i3.p1 GENE.c8637_g1_i3~~c8637_g1_i3.p1  ORF type:complete len:122 (+),score=5.98 c8637_g1_i3:236-601(+)